MGQVKCPFKAAQFRSARDLSAQAGACVCLRTAVLVFRRRAFCCKCGIIKDENRIGIPTARISISDKSVLEAVCPSTKLVNFLYVCLLLAACMLLV
jgi:hypothetical protein